ncbi:MAG: phosphodiesterase [Gammaproteobacteria bacterium]|nr:phosphodiesterase [Gammaproteobacteria bacterium]
MRILLGLLLILSLPLAQADYLRTPIGQQGDQTLALPELGQSMASVLARFGEPLEKHAAVGQPPISRWDYPQFSVYFEYQHVLTTVRKRLPPPPLPPVSVPDESIP